MMQDRVLVGDEQAYIKIEKNSLFLYSSYTLLACAPPG
jgi:hypothetical protein